MSRRVILLVAIALAASLAGPSAWAHTFPSVRTVVMQVERCELVLLVGFRPSTGEASDAMLLRAVNQPKSQGLDALRVMMGERALEPLHVAVDGKPLVPTAVRTKIGVEPGGARPMIVMLVSYPLPPGKLLSITSREPRTTRISWVDQASTRIDTARSSAQGKWSDSVASFLLTMSASSCGPSPSSSPSSHP